jgi:hypothetical protein
MADTTNEQILGVFTRERETKNTVLFSRTTETGRKESQYVPKIVFGDARPEEIEVLVRW